MSSPLSPEDLLDRLRALPHKAWDGVSPFAIGVSGGPDSMALVWLMSALYRRGDAPAFHAVTVDHGLRFEAAAEAERVAAQVKTWSGVIHAILTRPKPDKATRILEAARADRYRILQSYCLEHGLPRLFVAHHMDDQAETLLLRLAAGSGLDGLAGMASVKTWPNGLQLCRPLLDVAKVDLIETCEANNVSYINDPSNENDAYARPRLRQSAAILEGEGLTPERLARTAKRLADSREALEYYSEKHWLDAVLEIKPKRIVFKFSVFNAAPRDIRLRLLKRACLYISQADARPSGYGPRLEKLEEIEAGFQALPPQRRATLAGCLFSLKTKDDTLVVETEA